MASHNTNNPSPQSQEEAEVVSFLAESSLSATYDDDDVEDHDIDEAPEIMAARQLVQLSGDSGDRSTEEEGEEVGPRAAAKTGGGEKTRPCGKRKRKYLPIAVVYAKTRPMPVMGTRRR